MVHCGAIKPNHSFKGNSILVASELIKSIQSTIQSIDSNLTEWDIVEEKYLQNFGNSNFRTQGLFYLAEINGIVQYKLWELTGTGSVLCPSVHRTIASFAETNRKSRGYKGGSVAVRAKGNRNEDLLAEEEAKRRIRG